MNLTSAKALANAEETHLLDSLTLVSSVRSHLPDGRGRIIDVGSGAGFPGIPLKLVLEALDIVYLEATRKKANFLNWACASLKLEHTKVVNGRAEESGHDPNLREAFDIAVARALGQLAVVLELTLPFCRIGGLLLMPRGKEAERDASEALKVAEKLGGEIISVDISPADKIGSPTRIVKVRKSKATPGKYPRRAGIPGKRPLNRES
jgi:16S rRNA (guanine527-N7)-methyltransferase